VTHERRDGVEKPGAPAVVVLLERIQLARDEQAHPVVISQQGEQPAQMDVLQPVHHPIAAVGSHGLDHVLALPQGAVDLPDPVDGTTRTDNDTMPS
jgi:hypothetical protein